MIAQNRQNEFTAPNQDYYDDFIKASILIQADRSVKKQFGGRVSESSQVLTDLRRRELRESA